MPKEANLSDPKILIKQFDGTNAAIDKFQLILDTDGRTLFLEELEKARENGTYTEELLVSVAETRQRVVSFIKNGGMKNMQNAQQGLREQMESLVPKSLSPYISSGSISYREAIQVPRKPLPAENAPAPKVEDTVRISIPDAVVLPDTEITTAPISEEPEHEVAAEEVVEEEEDKERIFQEALIFFDQNRLSPVHFRIARTILNFNRHGLEEERLQKRLSSAFYYNLSFEQIEFYANEVNRIFVMRGVNFEIVRREEEVEGQTKITYRYVRPNRLPQPPTILEQEPLVQLEAEPEPKVVASPPGPKEQRNPTAEELMQMLSSDQLKLLEQLDLAGEAVSLLQLWGTIRQDLPTKSRLNSLAGQIEGLRPLLETRGQKIILQTSGNQTYVQIANKDEEVASKPSTRTAQPPATSPVIVYVKSDAQPLPEMDEATRQQVLDKTGVDGLRIVISHLIHATPARHETEIMNLPRDPVQLLAATSISPDRISRALASETPDNRKKEIVRRIIKAVEFYWSRKDNIGRNHASEDSLVQGCLTLMNRGISLERAVEIIGNHFQVELPHKYSTRQR